MTIDKSLKRDIFTSLAFTTFNLLLRTCIFFLKCLLQKIIKKCNSILEKNTKQTKVTMQDLLPLMKTLTTLIESCIITDLMRLL